jgi:ABC-type nitrate/sulfonate/bicarbonate transport system substrate-binding protein
VKKFVRAFLTGTIDARAHPGRALAILSKVTASDKNFLERATPATVRLLGDGCLNVQVWQRFGDWMHARGLLKQPVRATEIVDARFLPARCH